MTGKAPRVAMTFPLASREDVSSLLSTLTGLDDLWAEAPADAPVEVKREPEAPARSHSQPISAPATSADADAPGVLRKRGRPKGSVQTPYSGLTVKDLEARLAEIHSRLDALKLENEFLSHKKTMLELVIKTRDEQLLRFELLQTQGADEHVSLWNTTTQELQQELSLTSLAKRAKEAMQQVGTALLEGELSGDYTELFALVRRLQDAVKMTEMALPACSVMYGRDLCAASVSLDEATIAPQAWVLSEMYTAWHARLLSQRQHITRQLSHSLADSTQAGNRAYDLSRSLSLANKEESLEQLQANTTRERCLICLVGDVFRSHILQPLQYAKLILHVYPYCPDWIAIMPSVAALHGPPSNLPLPHTATAAADPHTNTATTTAVPVSDTKQTTTKATHTRRGRANSLSRQSVPVDFPGLSLSPPTCGPGAGGLGLGMGVGVGVGVAPCVMQGSGSLQPWYSDLSTLSSAASSGSVGVGGVWGLDPMSGLVDMMRTTHTQNTHAGAPGTAGAGVGAGVGVLGTATAINGGYTGGASVSDNGGPQQQQARVSEPMSGLVNLADVSRMWASWPTRPCPGS